jgi:hypothetical protein
VDFTDSADERRRHSNKDSLRKFTLQALYLVRWLRLDRHRFRRMRHTNAHPLYMTRSELPAGERATQCRLALAASHTEIMPYSERTYQPRRSPTLEEAKTTYRRADCMEIVESYMILDSRRSERRIR